MSFDVLHLLAHLFDQDLHFDGGTRGFQILRLRGQGVRLAIEFLHQEIEAPSRWLIADEGFADFGHVAAQPVDFLVDVEALRQDGEFLFEPIVIDVAD